MVYDIGIVGGGASGMAAAINAKRTAPHLKIALFEAMPRVGKKILATGNGRCNLSNLNAGSLCYNSGFSDFALKSYSPEKTLDFFHSLGLVCVSDGEGRVYPMSNSASTVLDCLRNELESMDVDIFCGVHVDRVIKKKNRFLLNEAECSALIIAAGGKASPAQGSDGSGYLLLKQLGHSVTELFPGLVKLKTAENVKSITGVRSKARVELFSGSKRISAADGEVLFTDFGISGIAVMDVSRKIANGNCILVLDVLSAMDFNSAVDMLASMKKHNPKLTVGYALGGMLHIKLAEYVLKRAGIKPNTPLCEIGAGALKAAVSTAKALKFTVNGTAGFNNAQITVGGASLSEFSPKTLESKIVSGLYCTGEILDIDAPCGGFNLQWAWSSGLLAGECAARKIEKQTK